MTARESEILKKREWSGQMTGFARGPAEPFPGHHARSGPSRCIAAGCIRSCP